MSELLRLGTGGVLLAALLSVLVALGCDHPTAASPAPPASVVSQPAVHTLSDAAESESESESASPSAEIALASAAETVAQAAAEAPAKTPAKDSARTRAPADRGPTRKGDAQKITFDDLNLGMSQDMVFRPFLVTDRVKELDGTRVRITGFIHGGAAGTKGIREFVLLKNTECKFGAGGQADHLAMVYLTPDQTTKYQLEAVKVEGVLKVKPYEGTDGNTWSVYDLTDAKLVQ